MDAHIREVNRNRIGIVGAGTMGSGIALTSLLVDLDVTLYDVDNAMLEKARRYVETQLERKKKAISIKYLHLSTDLETMSGAGYVIEATPEDLNLKKEVFSCLDNACPPPAILATNTSTLPVTAIAAATRTPGRVAGMHFFNPASVMPLVEVVRGAQTTSETIQALIELAYRLGKTPFVASDTPGFIVNRVARPFYGEALRLLGEGVATIAEIDQIVQVSGNFRMGPFRLMDLIGIDVNFAATCSTYEQTFAEPRYRPHRIQAQMVQQNTLGRKTGRGFYDYTTVNTEPKSILTHPNPSFSCKGWILIGPGSWAPGLEGVIRRSGCDIAFVEGDHQETQLVTGFAVAGRAESLQEYVLQMDGLLSPEVPLFCQCADVTLAEVSTWIERPERLVGFDGLFIANGSLTTMVHNPALDPQIKQSAEAIVSSLGSSPIWVTDSPALVLPRIVCALANEAAFTAGEGVALPETIDQAMQLGMNYPKGPLAWAGEIGFHRVVAVLDHLSAEYGEERYRVAPLLRRWARLGRDPSLKAFHDIAGGL